MFKIKFNPDEVKEKRIISPEDLLPKKVETTDGKISPFDPQRIVNSLIEETGLDAAQATQVATKVLKRLSTLKMEFIAAPHLRELVCGELTAMGLNQFRAKYTRLGIPIYDVGKMLKSQKGSHFFNLLAAQVIEQYVHLDRLSEDAQQIIDQIKTYSAGCDSEMANLILKHMENALKLYKDKQESHLV